MTVPGQNKTDYQRTSWLSSELRCELRYEDGRTAFRFREGCLKVQDGNEAQDEHLYAR